MNNKGFAISAVLYTVLIVFLLFLAVSLSMISSSTWIFSNANKDLTNGTELEAYQVKLSEVDVDGDGNINENEKCVGNSALIQNNQHYWLNTNEKKSDGNYVLKPNRFLARINTQYGTVNFPNDISEKMYYDASSYSISLKGSSGNLTNNGYFVKSKNLIWNLYYYNSNYGNGTDDSKIIKIDKKYRLVVVDNKINPSFSENPNDFNCNISGKAILNSDNSIISGVVCVDLSDYCN